MRLIKHLNRTTIVFQMIREKFFFFFFPKKIFNRKIKYSKENITRYIIVFVFLKNIYKWTLLIFNWSKMARC